MITVANFRVFILTLSLAIPLTTSCLDNAEIALVLGSVHYEPALKAWPREKLEDFKNELQKELVSLKSCTTSSSRINREKGFYEDIIPGKTITGTCLSISGVGALNALASCVALAGISGYRGAKTLLEKYGIQIPHFNETLNQWVITSAAYSGALCVTCIGAAYLALVRNMIIRGQEARKLSRHIQNMIDYIDVLLVTQE